MLLLIFITKIVPNQVIVFFVQLSRLLKLGIVGTIFFHSRAGRKKNDLLFYGRNGRKNAKRQLSLKTKQPKKV